MELISRFKRERVSFRGIATACMAVALAAGTTALVRKETQAQNAEHVAQLLAAQLCSATGGDVQQRGQPAPMRETFFSIAKREYKLRQLTGQQQPQDFEQAVRAYQRGASIGDPDALHNMGVIHAYGIAVVQDEVEALKWLLIASTVQPSDDTAELIRKIESGMTPAKRAEAQSLSSAWRRGPQIVAVQDGQ